MPNVKDLLRKIESGDISYEEKLAALSQVETSLQELKAKKEERVRFNVQLIIDEIKKVKQDVQAQLDYARSIIPERGPKGDKGDRGLDGAPGKDGRDGKDGRNGKDGKDGQDGVSVTDAKIDFDGSLIITLSTGREINVGEVVAADLAEKIKVTMSTNSAVTIQDEGVTLTSGVRSINFTGTGVTATASDDSVTVNVSGGGGGGSGTVTSVAMSVPAFLSVSGSPITTSGTLAVSYSGTALPVANGGSGQTSYTDGQLLIGNSTGNTLTKATLTQGSGITITNGSGAITIANAAPMTYPGAGIPNSTGSAWGTSYSTTGSGTVVALATSPSFTTPTLGAASATTINKVTITTPATGSTLTIADGKTLTINNSITFSGTDSTTMTLPGVNATLAALAVAQSFTATQTFTQVNYTVNTVTVTSNAGTVPITHRVNNFTNSSAATMTITMATASAVDGQMSIVRIYDFSAAAQTISWVNTENSTVTAPTTSNGSTTLPLTVGFMYNSATSKWRCIASA